MARLESGPAMMPCPRTLAVSATNLFVRLAARLVAIGLDLAALTPSRLICAFTGQWQREYEMSLFIKISLAVKSCCGIHEMDLHGDLISSDPQITPKWPLILPVPAHELVGWSFLNTGGLQSYGGSLCREGLPPREAIWIGSKKTQEYFPQGC